MIPAAKSTKTLGIKVQESSRPGFANAPCTAQVHAGLQGGCKQQHCPSGFLLSADERGVSSCCLPWLPAAVSRAVQERKAARLHFATDLFPCELMKQYTQFQKKKIFYRPIILLSQYNATVKDLVSVNRRSNSDHQLSQISCTNTTTTGLMPLPHKSTVLVQTITLPTMLFRVQKP